MKLLSKRLFLPEQNVSVPQLCDNALKSEPQYLYACTILDDAISDVFFSWCHKFTTSLLWLLLVYSECFIRGKVTFHGSCNIHTLNITGLGQIIKIYTKTVKIRIYRVN